MGNITRVRVDIAKSIFHANAVDRSSEILTQPVLAVLTKVRLIDL